MYQLFAPTPILRPYIENYWMLKTQSADDAPLQEAIFVDGRADILFNFGVPYLRGNPTENLHAVTISNVDAQRTYPVAIQQTGAIHLVGVRFKVGGLAVFVRQPLYQLSDNVVAVEDIFGKLTHDLEGCLYECNHPISQIALLDDFFCSCLYPHDTYRLVMHISNQLARRENSVLQISADVGYSIRTVDRLFKQVIGFSPKFYARIARLEGVIATLHHNPFISLTELALHYGYYDQAHFTKEFKDFTGQTPLAYRAKLQHHAHHLAPNVVQFLQDRPDNFG